MPELDPDMSITETTNDCASKYNSEHHCVGAIEPFSTPMPSVQCVLDDIDQTYGHMPPLPPSELALKLKILRERQENINGDNCDFETNEDNIHAHCSIIPASSSNKETNINACFADTNNDPDFTNQECTTNSRFTDREPISSTQEWRNCTPKSKNNNGSKLNESPQFISIPIHPPQPTKRELEDQYGRRILAFEYCNIISKFNKKHNINQTDFDDYSFDNVEEEADWGKLKKLKCNTPEMKKILKDAKEFQKTIHLPKKQRTA